MTIGDVGKNSSDKKPSFHFVLKIISLALFVGVAYGVRHAVSTFTTSAKIKMKQASGHGWDGAREELTKRFDNSVRTNVNSLNFEDSIINALVKCEVDKYILWLNTTNCYYMYNRNLTTAEDHVREQDLCLSRSGNNEKISEIDLVCTKKIIPNSWRIFERYFSDTFHSSLREKLSNRREKNASREIANCVSRSYVYFLDSLNCKPMNMQAVNINELFSNQDTCLKKFNKKISQQIDQAWKNCLKQPK